jgi:hypothetical protein
MGSKDPVERHPPPGDRRLGAGHLGAAEGAPFGRGVFPVNVNAFGDGVDAPDDSGTGRRSSPSSASSET